MRLILTGAERWPSCRGRPKLWTISLTHEGNSWQRGKWFRLCLNTIRHSYTFIHHWLQCLFAKLDQYSGGLQEKHFLKTCYFILVFQKKLLPSTWKCHEAPRVSVENGSVQFLKRIFPTFRRNSDTHCTEFFKLFPLPKNYHWKTMI